MMDADALVGGGEAERWVDNITMDLTEIGSMWNIGGSDGHLSKWH